MGRVRAIATGLGDSRGREIAGPRNWYEIVRRRLAVVGGDVWDMTGRASRDGTGGVGRARRGEEKVGLVESLVNR